MPRSGIRGLARVRPFVTIAAPRRHRRELEPLSGEANRGRRRRFVVPPPTEHRGRGPCRGRKARSTFRSATHGSGGERANILLNGLRGGGAPAGSLVLLGVPVAEVRDDPPGWPPEVPDLLCRGGLRPAQACAARPCRPRQASGRHSASSLTRPPGGRARVSRHTRFPGSGPTLFVPCSDRRTSARTSCVEVASD